MSRGQEIKTKDFDVECCPNFYEEEYARLTKENIILGDQLEKLRIVHIETATRLLNEINELRQKIAKKL